MMEDRMSYTSGPWTIERPGVIVDAHRRQLCVLNDSLDSWREHEALIAAAPELLEALKRMDELVDSLWESVPWGKTFNLNVALLNEAPIEAKKAIAKAEGRTMPERVEA
jgi:hypothetical protein